MMSSKWTQKESRLRKVTQKLDLQRLLSLLSDFPHSSFDLLLLDFDPEKSKPHSKLEGRSMLDPRRGRGRECRRCRDSKMEREKVMKGKIREVEPIANERMKLEREHLVCRKLDHFSFW